MSGVKVAGNNIASTITQVWLPAPTQTPQANATGEPVRTPTMHDRGIEEHATPDSEEFDARGQREEAQERYPDGHQVPEDVADKSPIDLANKDKNPKHRREDKGATT
eukprot:108941-Amphidinium_carterae.1